MTASEEHPPDSSSDSPGPHESPEEHSRETAERLRAAVAELASRLRPFPPFYGRSTLRAIELELPLESAVRPPPELGCVVVLPDGEISELDLRNIPGPDGPAAIDQVEEFTELDLPPEQYVAYATVALQLLQAEMVRRSGD